MTTITESIPSIPSSNFCEQSLKSLINPGEALKPNQIIMYEPRNTLYEILGVCKARFDDEWKEGYLYRSINTQAFYWREFADFGKFICISDDSIKNNYPITYYSVWAESERKEYCGLGQGKAKIDGDWQEYQFYKDKEHDAYYARPLVESPSLRALYAGLSRSE